MPLLINKYNWYTGGWPVTTRCGTALYYSAFHLSPKHTYHDSIPPHPFTSSVHLILSLTNRICSIAQGKLPGILVTHKKAHIQPLINPVYRPPSLPSISVSHHGYLQLTAYPPFPKPTQGQSLSLLSVSLLCQWGMPLTLCNNKAFKGWWCHSGNSLWPAHSIKITCWCPLWGET